ncbi:MAG TPA: hypothetical protein VFM96_01700 [Gaiellaceae bacterium]|nr:hypothetical protein [Gaiellaceae bacterium]
MKESLDPGSHGLRDGAYPELNLAMTVFAQQRTAFRFGNQLFPSSRRSTGEMKSLGGRVEVMKRQRTKTPRVTADLAPTAAELNQALLISALEPELVTAA